MPKVKFKCVIVVIIAINCFVAEASRIYKRQSSDYGSDQDFRKNEWIQVDTDNFSNKSDDANQACIKQTQADGATQLTPTSAALVQNNAQQDTSQQARSTVSTDTSQQARPKDPTRLADTARLTDPKDPTRLADTSRLTDPTDPTDTTRLAGTSRPPRPSWQRHVALFLIGQAITLFGTMITGYAITWYVTLQTQSGVMVMLFSIAMMVPMAIASPLGGVWADRYNRKYLINIVDAAIALVTLAMALFFSVGIQWIGLLLICTLARGFGQGIQMPTVTAILPDIVPAEQLVRINGFNSSIQSLSTFASPMLGGALMSFFPVQVLMYIDVVTAAVGIAIVFFCVRTHKGWRRTIEVAAASTKPSFKHEFMAGLRYVKSHHFIMAFMLMAIIFNVFAVPAALLTPLQVTRDFGDDPWRLAAIEVVFSVGMMIGGALIGIWGGFKNRIFTMALATLLFGLGTVGLGLLDNFWVYLACMTFVGITMPIFNAPMMGIMQEKIDADFMGRVFSVFMMLSSLAMPIGIAVFGPFADVIPIDWLLIATGFGIALLAIYLIANRHLRKAGVPASAISSAVDSEAASVVKPAEASNAASAVKQAVDSAADSEQ